MKKNDMVGFLRGNQLSHQWEVKKKRGEGGKEKQEEGAGERMASPSG